MSRALMHFENTIKEIERRFFTDLWDFDFNLSGKAFSSESPLAQATFQNPANIMIGKLPCPDSGRKTLK